MATRIHSTTVKYGRNAEVVSYADDRYVKCQHCGFMCHLDRDFHSTRGAKVGNGVKVAQTQLNGAVTAADATITVDSTSGFATPSTASITAFATGGRNRTTVTSAAHGIKGGKVVITSTTNYNGTFNIDNVFTNTFDIRIPYVADDATGTWTVLEYMRIYDIDISAGSSTATLSDDSTARQDQSSTITAATGSPRSDKVSYTGLSSTTFTGCSGSLAHDDNMYVTGTALYSGCPYCGCYIYNE